MLCLSNVLHLSKRTSSFQPSTCTFPWSLKLETGQSFPLSGQAWTHECFPTYALICCGLADWSLTTTKASFLSSSIFLLSQANSILFSQLNYIKLEIPGRTKKNLFYPEATNVFGEETNRCTRTRC